MEVLTKGSLIEKVAAKAGKDIQSKAAAKRVLDVAFDEMSAWLKKGGDVRIDKFGSFSVVKRAAREGVNPSTKEKIHIPAKRAVKFSAAKTLKDMVQK